MSDERNGPSPLAGVSLLKAPAFAVETRADLEELVARLDAIGALNSGVERGLVGWFLVVKDPDGLSIRTFTRERHDIEHGIPETAWTRYPAEQEDLS